MATSISAQTAAANQPRVTTDGTLITRMQSYVTTASFAANDTIALYNMKVPHGATIRSFAIKAAGANGKGTWHMTIGDRSSAAWGGSVTAASGVLVGGFMDAPSAYNYKVSVTDGASVRYIVPMATITTATSSTVSTSLLFVVDYTMDP